VLVELRPPFGSFAVVTTTSVSGSATGSAFNNVWCISEKIAVLAPIPRPNEITTTRLTTGVRISARSEYRSPFI